MYFIPMIYLFYNNINGILHVEDFALHGIVDFTDYGFLISVLLLGLIFSTFNQKDYANFYNCLHGLFLLICLHFVFYMFIFTYSIFLQGSIEWPLKLGRYYLYEISVILFFLLLYNNPKHKFKKIVKFFEVYTILFSLMYILYNYFNIDFYADEAYEILETGKGEVTRNYAAFPGLLMYFYCLTLINFFKREGNSLLNILLIIIYMVCIVAVITRGLIISAAFIFVVAFLISPNWKLNLLYTLLFFGFGIILLDTINFFESRSFIALVERSNEIKNSGMQDTGNFAYRTEEFLVTFKNVLDFNPFIGFGFINMSEFGLYSNYNPNLINAGSPDNGFTNLLSVSGFIGLAFYLIIMFNWALLNIKLQKLKIDDYSKAHFLYFLYAILTFMYNDYNCFLEGFGLFLVYDLLIYRKYKHLTQPKKPIIFNSL